MSRADELRDEAALKAWKAEQALLTDLVNYVLARTPSCAYGACSAPALWRNTLYSSSGFPRDLLCCDEHKLRESQELAGADVIRRAVEKKKGGGT